MYSPSKVTPPTGKPLGLYAPPPIAMTMERAVQVTIAPLGTWKPTAPVTRSPVLTMLVIMTFSAYSMPFAFRTSMNLVRRSFLAKASR